jgi:hypothetical protein
MDNISQIFIFYPCMYILLFSFHEKGLFGIFGKKIAK